MGSSVVHQTFELKNRNQHDQKSNLNFDRLLYRTILPRMSFARSLDQASSSYLLAATDPCWEGVGGNFIKDSTERRLSDESYDELRARQLWKMSWTWCGLGGNVSV